MGVSKWWSIPWNNCLFASSFRFFTALTLTLSQPGASFFIFPSSLWNSANVISCSKCFAAFAASSSVIFVVLSAVSMISEISLSKRFSEIFMKCSLNLSGLKCSSSKILRSLHPNFFRVLYIFLVSPLCSASLISSTKLSHQSRSHLFFSFLYSFRMFFLANIFSVLSTSPSAVSMALVTWLILIWKDLISSLCVSIHGFRFVFSTWPQMFFPASLTFLFSSFHVISERLNASPTDVRNCCFVAGSLSLSQLMFVLLCCLLSGSFLGFCSQHSIIFGLWSDSVRLVVSVLTFFTKRLCWFCLVMKPSISCQLFLAGHFQVPLFLCRKKEFIHASSCSWHQFIKSLPAAFVLPRPYAPATLSCVLLFVSPMLEFQSPPMISFMCLSHPRICSLSSSL